MNKEYQSRTLLDLVEQKENLTNTVDNRTKHMDEITNNGTFTKEDMKKNQARCEKKEKHLAIGLFSSIITSAATLIAAIITAVSTTSMLPLTYTFVGSTFLLIVLSSILYMLDTNFQQKNRVLINRIEHLEEVEKELENATKDLDKVMEDIRSLSASDVELAQLEANRDKAQALLKQFLTKTTSNTKQNKIEATDAIEEEDELGTK